MKCYTLLLFIMIAGLNTHAKEFRRTPDGIIVYPETTFSGNTQVVRLQLIDEGIVRVLGIADSTLLPLKSMMISGRSKPVKFDIISNEKFVTLKTLKLSVTVDLQTGRVSFFNILGEIILAEKQLGRSLYPVVFDGEKLFAVTQDFVTSSDDSRYGLGQHQNGLMDYKTYQVQLFQNNTEVAVPFLVSRKNYGILWDNYSLTKFGDVRPYQPLNQLRLFSKDDQGGWLTATYSNDRHNAGDVLVQRPESDIHLEFLGDSKLYLPQKFNPANGIVKWEGSIASDAEGVYKLRLTFGGYLKVWIDGNLLLDKWRVCWNPASAVLDIPFQQGKKYAFRIEWIPDGGESYLSLKTLSPLSADEKNSFSFSSEAAQQLDYYFIYGEDIDQVISGYRQLTGKATMLPRWAFGFWQSRERYKTQEEILATVAEFRKRKIPLDNIVLDWSYWKEDQWGSQEFDPARFPSPENLIAELHDKYKTQLMISVWPKFYEGIPTYNEMNRHGWLYTRNIADSVRDWIGKGYHSTFYDVFNKEARAGFWELLNKNLYSKGVDAWWMDASEPDILSNVSPRRRKEQMMPNAAGTSALVLNAYPLLNAKGIYEGQRQANPNNRVFILTRSAYAGSQAYSAATWSGDIAARWHDMKDQISAGINFSMSGIPYWTMDIGGFDVERRFEKPDEADRDEWREMNTRWYQFGAFVPLFRVHGQFPYREIFNIAPENHPAYLSMLYYNKLRYRLLPYIYSLAGNAYLDDGTIMRGLVMDFPKDNNAIHLNDEYLFGPSLLINPVTEYKARKREVYLPEGTGWYDFYNGKYFEGGQRINADAPYQRIPVYVREGAIIPFGPDLQYTSEKPADVITLYVYTGKDGDFTLYEDEGTNYNYEKGRYSTISIVYNQKEQSLTIGKRKGTFEGMLRRRTFKVIWVDKINGIGVDTDSKVFRTVNYSGNVVTIRKT